MFIIGLMGLKFKNKTYSPLAQNNKIKMKKKTIENAVLKKPPGMCKVLFKDIAWLLALNMKEQRKDKTHFQKRSKR